MQIQETGFPELGWLAEVVEIAEPLSESRPIWVSHQTFSKQPQQWQAQRHPYCEVNLLVRGSMLHYSQRQQSPRQRGDLFLAGPGVPHFSARSRYPLEWISVYFLPSEVLELDRGGDGGQILQRIAVVDPAGDHYIRPLPELRRRLLRGFGELVDEFQGPAFGSRLKSRALLSALLVDIMRGEQAKGWTSGKRPREGNWVLAEKALNYLRDHFAEQIYTRDLTAATGLSESGLRNVFRECVGMPWVQYLQAYRIHRAAALLVEPGASVTAAALAVGFGNLGHFSTAFHACMKVSPRDFTKNRAVPSDGNPGDGGQR